MERDVPIEDEEMAETDPCLDCDGEGCDECDGTGDAPAMDRPAYRANRESD